MLANHLLLTPHIIPYAYVVYKINYMYSNCYLWSVVSHYTGKLTRLKSYCFLARLVRDKDDGSSLNEQSQLYLEKAYNFCYKNSLSTSVSPFVTYNAVN